MDPFLPDFHDPVPVLQVFTTRLRRGQIAPRQNPIRARSVEDYLRTVGQEFASMGAPDPRIILQGNIDFRLQRQLAYYTKQDPPRLGQTRPDRDHPARPGHCHRLRHNRQPCGC